MKIRHDIEALHEEFGRALFVLPLSLLGLAITAVASGLSLLLR